MSKKSAVKLGLLIDTERRDGYLHIHAYPMTIGLNAWEMRQIDAGHPAPNPDVKHDAVRYAGDETINGLYLNGLRVTSQGHEDATERHLYGFQVRYQNVFAVELREAEQMYKTLKAIGKRMDRIYNKYGSTASYGQYLSRVAEALGVTTFLIRKNGEYRFYDAPTAIYYVDGIVRDWAQEGKAVAS